MPGSSQSGAPPRSVWSPEGTAKFAVFRYNQGGGGSEAGDWEWLPWLMFRSVQRRIGASPWVAHYRFDFRDDNPPEWPHRMEDALDFDFQLDRNRLSNDDRIVVARLMADGSIKFYHDGFVRLPQVDATDSAEQVTIESFGVPVRLLDRPIGGHWLRDSHKLDPANSHPAGPGGGIDDQGYRDIWKDGPVRFNPDGRPNATPVDKDPDMQTEKPSEADDAITRRYPVFVDSTLDRDPDYRAFWTLGMAIRYLAYTNEGDQFWVKTPLLTDSDYQAIVPDPDPDGPIDLNNADTYKYEDIILPDVDVSGLTWAEAIAKLVEPYGFVFAWTLGQTLVDAGEEGKLPIPKHSWKIMRRDKFVRKRGLLLDKAGKLIDWNKTNITQLSLQREFPRANRVRVRTAVTRHEIGVILQPGFAIAAADATDANVKKFDKTYKTATESFKDYRNKYRLFHAGEGGDPYWNVETNDWDTRPLDLSPIFPDEGDNRTYSHVRRAGINQLISKDSAGRLLEAQLRISPDWGTIGPGGRPMLWEPKRGGDGGTWQVVGPHGWRLLPDRLGIYLDVKNPNEWVIDPINPPDPRLWSSGKVNVVKCLATPEVYNAGASAADPRKPNVLFWLMLVCVIESDHDIKAIARQRDSCLTQFIVERFEDSRDRFHKEVVTESSPFNDQTPPKEVAKRDDTVKAVSRAVALRRRMETADVSGRVTVPWCSDAYELGDAITGVKGRGIDFNALGGSTEKESPVLPILVGIDVIAEPHNTTTLHLSDTRGQPPHIVETPKKKVKNDTAGVEWPMEGSGLFGRPGEILPRDV